jgi:cytochrome c oxidase subunit 2
VLHPGGPDAARVRLLTEVMTWGSAAILLLVVVATLLAVLLPHRRRRWMTRRGFVVGLGVALPVVVLTALLGWGLGLTGALATAGPPGLRVAVTGEMWWWRVSYRDAEGREVFETANEIRIPVGVPVEFALASDNVIHSFWVPALGGKQDMIPGRVNRLVLTADRPGTYRGQCAEYCGDMHSLMALAVVVEPTAAWRGWWESQAEAAAAPATERARRGAAVFERSGCGACHRVRGTTAVGVTGPDLTHVGSRLTLAAGTLPRNAGTFAAWISSSQHLKPGNRMPAFDHLSGEDLTSLAAWLEGLK